MGKKTKELSQAEIWDDSALLQSWDDALAEYKLYHSIHARGERVEDVVQEYASGVKDMDVAEDELLHAAAGMQTNGISSEKPEEEPDTAPAYLKGDLREDVEGPSIIDSEHTQGLSNTSTGVDQKATPEMPDAVTNRVKDENLKNLMMSWYYAGYYTGLYEGQQHIQSNTSN